MSPDFVFAEPEAQAPFPDPSLLYPSDAYTKNSSSYTYRISELIFGSLLASYVLGFLNVSTGIVSEVQFPSSPQSFSPYYQLLSSVSISVSFALLTASSYVSYHNSILTMPSIKVGNLRVDFLLAISQAILFGFSMLFPHTFLLWLGVSLWFILFRQRDLLAELALMMYDQHHKLSPSDRKIENFLIPKRTRKRIKEASKVFVKALTEYQSTSELDADAAAQSWQMAPARITFACYTLLVLGLLWSICFNHLLKIEDHWRNLLQLIIYLGVLGGIFYSTRTVLSRRAETANPVSPNKGYDPEYGFDRVYAYAWQFVKHDAIKGRQGTTKPS